MRQERNEQFSTHFQRSMQQLVEDPMKLQGVTYTDAVIKETLRLFPVGFGVRRDPRGLALNYDGQDFPIDNDLTVFLNCRDLHYDERFFAIPTSFEPDRWLDDKIPRSYFRAFGRGARSCLGQNLRQHELKIILLMTMRDYTFECPTLVPNTKPRTLHTDLDTVCGDVIFQELGIDARPRGKMMMVVKKRVHKRRRKHNRHQLHRERSPEPKGRHRRHHASRRDLSDAPSDESDSDDGYDIDLNEGLSNPDIDHYEGRDVASPSNPEGRLTASLPSPRSPSQGVPLTSLKHASAHPDGDCAKDCRDGSPSLHDTLDSDLDDTASDSDEHRVGDYSDTPPSSLETSRHEEDEGNTHGSRSYDSDGDQEVNVCPTATRLHKDAHVDLGDTCFKSHESEEDPGMNLGDGSIGATSENEGELDDSLGQDEGYASVSRETTPEKLERASTITSVVPASSQEDVSGPGGFKAELTASNSSPGTEIPALQPQSSSLAKPPIDFSPGSIVRRKSWRKFRGRWRFDYHPHLITQNVLDDNGKTAVMACLCTSRPKLDLFTEQYKEQKKKHYCYLGGIEEGNFETDNTPRPTEAELDIEGPPMPIQTYIELEEGGPFDLGDFKSFGDQPRRLTLTSREKFFNLYTPALHGCKKSPPGSVPAAQPEILM
ncbi:hypothetical protein NM208_g5489 [Fusarium decemcellulare]|uniref:Uncharacterized protein n=1 Tax=Fusarium decemcellulare TaxID=57161 RepID=A0ACC1SH08_9HYPO|nr:hypothetical protein NM208_g5489 [Fusarium decemcellulare]